MIGQCRILWGFNGIKINIQAQNIKIKGLNGLILGGIAQDGGQQQAAILNLAA